MGFVESNGTFTNADIQLICLFLRTPLDNENQLLEAGMFKLISDSQNADLLTVVYLFSIKTVIIQLTLIQALEIWSSQCSRYLFKHFLFRHFVMPDRSIDIGLVKFLIHFGTLFGNKQHKEFLLAQSTSILFIAFNNHPYVFRVESSRF
jgi:hypothetical protein